jgi:hypothetical protein
MDHYSNVARFIEFPLRSSKNKTSFELKVKYVHVKYKTIDFTVFGKRHFSNQIIHFC